MVFIWKTKNSKSDKHRICGKSQFKLTHWLDAVGDMTAGTTVVLLFCKTISSEGGTLFKVRVRSRPWDQRTASSPNLLRLNSIAFWTSTSSSYNNAVQLGRLATIKLVIPAKTHVRLYLTHVESKFLANVSITETFEKIRITTLGNPSLETGWNG